MRVPIAPASDAIFNAVVYTNGQLASAPQTDAQWTGLREQAESLMTSTRTLASLTPEGSPAEWLAQTRALEVAAEQTAKAIDVRSLDGVLEGGGKIYETCTRCHAAYAVGAD